MPIRVAINATPVLSPLTGIGNYIIELGAALARLAAVDVYSFYRYQWRHEYPRVPRADEQPLEYIVERVKPVLPLRGAFRHAVRYLGFSNRLASLGIDLYHEPNYVPLTFDVPVAVTVHDLSWLRYPEAHPVDRVRWLERGVPAAMARASAIIVDSDFIRREVLTTFGVDERRVITAHLGVREHFRPRAESDVAGSLKALGLEYGRYILTVGTIEPRKNLRHVLDAHDLLPESLRERFPLVVAGAKGWQSSDLVTRMRAVTDRHVRFIGAVGRGQLPDLYAGAALFVFPSLYEGFGLTPLEAMASGVPVIASRTASMPEVIGEAGELLDPHDPVGTAERIRAVLEDDARRAAMAVRGPPRAALFNWDDCAAKTLAAYRFALAPEGDGAAA